MPYINLCISSLLVLAILSNCSTPRPGGKTEAEILYKEAQQLVEDGRYLMAKEKLNTIRSQFPYSYFATHAELLNADILFAQQNYVEAAAAYTVFKDFHPKNKRLAYVIWRIGESFFKQLPSTYDRDLSSGFQAVKYFKELIHLYPRSQYTLKAKEKIAFCQKQFKLKERYIADFYYKTSVYDSARFRYLKILDNYQNDSELRGHSMVRIVYASAYLNHKNDCLKYYRQFKEKIKGQSFKRDLEKAYRICQNTKTEKKS